VKDHVCHCRCQKKHFTNLFFCLGVSAPQEVAPPPPPQNMNDVLRPSPRMPALDTKLPESMVHLLTEWKNRGLVSFATCNKKAWPGNIRQCFAKRKYLYDTIVARSSLDESSLEAAAGSLDRDRDRRTMGNFLKALQKNDPGITRRQRRPREEEEPPPPRSPPPLRTPTTTTARQRRQVTPGSRLPRPRGSRQNPILMMDGPRPMHMMPNIPWEATGYTSGRNNFGEMY
jgi:hypothetical protein